MKIEFSTDSAAFTDNSDDKFLNDIARFCECKRILEKVITELQIDKTSGVIMDINGNKIGKWSL